MERTRIYLTESISGKERHRPRRQDDDYSILAAVITVIGYLIIVSGFS